MRSKDGNPVITVVDRSGVHKLGILYCICSGALPHNQQLFTMGLLAATFKKTEMVFTFDVLDDFLLDNLECKTTAQLYYSKLQAVTNGMFPSDVLNCYKQLLRAAWQWCDIKTKHRSGLRFPQEVPSDDGSATIFCPACPQPGVNLPNDWETQYTKVELMRTFIMDGNFVADYMRSHTNESDIALSPGQAFMVRSEPFQAHLQRATEPPQACACHHYKAIEQANSSKLHLDVTGIGATACPHGFFVLNLVVDFQKGERSVI
ncbi:hypothetical protein BC834DRAFT_835379 [Gloeopeniophorella convolvens]|nr:hypothetical protein BC834DRAFT_835379 [Gloeopeniophorella convolvens]